MENKIIGYIVGGGLKESFRVRLTVDPLTVQEGAFVVIESGDYHFYGLVTDMRKDFFNHAIENEIEFYTKNDSGSLLSRLISEIVFIAAA